MEATKRIKRKKRQRIITKGTESSIRFIRYVFFFLFSFTNCLVAFEEPLYIYFLLYSFSEDVFFSYC